MQVITYFRYWESCDERRDAAVGMRERISDRILLLLRMCDQGPETRDLPIEARVHQLVVTRNWHGTLEDTGEHAEMITVTKMSLWGDQAGWPQLAEGDTASLALLSSAVAAQNKKLCSVWLCPGWAGEGGGRERTRTLQWPGLAHNTQLASHTHNSADTNTEGEKYKKCTFHNSRYLHD